MIARLLNRLADALVPTGPILDPEDCLDTEQPTSRTARCIPDAVECCGCGYWLHRLTAIHGQWDLHCVQCVLGRAWAPCGEVGGCSRIGVVRTDRCSGRWRDVFAGNDMVRPNYAPWPNPCAREV